MDRLTIISGLEFTKAMITFNPLSGQDRDPETLNKDDKITYDACVAAIALLKEDEKYIERLKKINNDLIDTIAELYYLENDVNILALIAKCRAEE